MRFENIEGDFKEIPGFEGYYVTQDGIVVTTRQGQPKLRKFTADVDGYMVISAVKNGRKGKLKRSRAVALAWISNAKPNLYNTVCHNDGTRTNDHVSNLRWATFRENMLDKRLHGTNVNSGGGRKLTPKQVEEIRESYNSGTAILSLANKYNLDRATIRRCVNYVTYQEVA